MNILYAGTPAIAVPGLAALVAAGHHVELLTNPDAPGGRGRSFVASPTKVLAVELGLTVHQPLKLDSVVRDLFQGRFDLLVSYAFGKIFGPLFLGLFPRGGLNVHPSLLPRWRGPSPLPAALLARDTQTGISVQRLGLKMDAGEVVISLARSLDGAETTGTLTEWAAAAAVPLLLEAVQLVEDGKGPWLPQDESKATYCSLISKEEGVLDWRLSSAELDARIRAYDPWPVASTTWNSSKLFLRKSSWTPSPPSVVEPGAVVSIDKSKGILVQTGDGLLAVREWQLPARKSLDFRSFLNGNPSLIGSRLGEPS